MNIKFYLLFLLAFSTSSLHAMVGKWRPNSLPFAPKWGAQLAAATCLVNTIVALAVRPKMKRAGKSVEAALTLLREILEEEDWRAEEEITHEYYRRRRIRNWYRSLYGVVTTLAVLSGLLTGCEIFNQWYWSPKRWRSLAMVYNFTQKKREWELMYHRALLIKMQDEVDPNIPHIEDYLPVRDRQAVEL